MTKNKTCYKEVGYRCGYCNWQAEDPDNMRNHLKKLLNVNQMKIVEIYEVREVL